MNYNFNYYLLNHLNDFKLSQTDALILLFLRYYSETNQEVNLQHIAENLGLEVLALGNKLDELMQKELIKIDSKQGKVYYDTNQLFSYQEKQSLTKTSPILTRMEKGFNRTLSQKEVAIMNELLQKYDIKLVEYALRETLLNQKNRIEYLEKILLNWHNIGYTAQDYEKGISAKDYGKNS